MSVKYNLEKILKGFLRNTRDEKKKLYYRQFINILLKSYNTGNRGLPIMIDCYMVVHEEPIRDLDITIFQFLEIYREKKMMIDARCPLDTEDDYISVLLYTGHSEHSEHIIEIEIGMHYGWQHIENKYMIEFDAAVIPIVMTRPYRQNLLKKAGKSRVFADICIIF